MGKALSIPQRYCITVPEHLVTIQYTVKRSSGELEAGWFIAENGIDHSGNITKPSASKYGRIQEGPTTPANIDNEWRVFVHNGKKDPHEYLWAWRRLGNIQPTELNGNQEAIEKWRTEVTDLFNKLELTRIENGGDVPLH